MTPIHHPGVFEEDPLSRILAHGEQAMLPEPTVLRPYQQVGFQWLYGLNREVFGGCLADDMGLGKTVQVLTLLDHLKKTDQYPVHRDHLAQYDVILTTYGTIRNDIEILQEIPFFYLILDESQNVRNPGSLTHRSVKKIQSFHRLVMTGTPVESRRHH